MSFGITGQSIKLDSIYVTLRVLFITQYSLLSNISIREMLKVEGKSFGHLGKENCNEIVFNEILQGVIRSSFREAFVICRLVARSSIVLFFTKAFVVRAGWLGMTLHGSLSC